MLSLLVTGGQGRLASAAEQAYRRRGWQVVSIGRNDLDITDADLVRSCVAAHRPDAILNLAAWTDVDGCESDPSRALEVNGHAVAHLRQAAEHVGAYLCQVSTDYVFDGDATVPYREDQPVGPLGVYGRSKHAGELAAGPDAGVVRVAWISGRVGKGLVRAALDAGRDPHGRPRFVHDQFGSPSVSEDLVDALGFVLEHRLVGTFHAVNQGVATPYDLACHVLEVAGLDPDRVEPVPSASMASAQAAQRPRFSALDATKLHEAGGPLLPPWRESVARLVGELLEADADAAAGASVRSRSRS